MLRLQTRYYRTIPLDDQGYEIETMELEPSRTALVVMHCWNIGCEDGPEVDPNFWVGMGSRECVAEAARIMRECIRPAIVAARNAGILVCHVENDAIAAKHPEAQGELDPVPPSPLGSPAARDTAPQPAVPGWREQMAARFHGHDYATKSPYARMDRAEVVAPLPGEPLVYRTGQLDRVLRRGSVENLIYTGFATDMCILRAEGSIEPMAALGYRIVLIRDCTLGVELPDTIQERIATRWAVRYIETHFGNTVSLADFLAALRS